MGWLSYGSVFVIEISFLGYCLKCANWEGMLDTKGAAAFNVQLDMLRLLLRCILRSLTRWVLKEVERGGFAATVYRYQTIV